MIQFLLKFLIQRLKRFADCLSIKCFIMLAIVDKSYLLGVKENLIIGTHANFLVYMSCPEGTSHCLSFSEYGDLFPLQILFLFSYAFQ